MESRAWIFVSHSSADLLAVRLVRNYLESKGAAPLLFHLRSLTKPEEFWPLIKREIEERRFFIYCDSAKAAESDWVKKERAAVAEMSRTTARRIEKIQVDGPAIDTAALDNFVRATRVFPNFAVADRDRVAPFLNTLRKVGFEVFDPLDIKIGFDWQESITAPLQAAAAQGWVVSFVSAKSMASRFVGFEIAAGLALGARFVPVLLEPVMVPPSIGTFQAFDATRHPFDAPEKLADLLLHRDAP